MTDGEVDKKTPEEKTKEFIERVRQKQRKLILTLEHGIWEGRKGDLTEE